jgi:hypothetical protein
MNQQEILQEFRRKVCDQIEVEPEGVNRYVVYTPFQFDDGDHFVTVLKQQNGHWLLSDEGHTLMHLSYGEFNLEAQTRKNIIDTALEGFGLDNASGELRLTITDGQFGDSLFSFSQALMKISDTAYWTRDRVASTFMEDFRLLMKEKLAEREVRFDYRDAIHDVPGNYLVDCYVGNGRPVFIFGILNDIKCLNSALTIMKFREWGSRFRSIGVFEDQTKVAAKNVAKFTDASDKNFSSLVAAQDIGEYVGALTDH